MCVTVNSDAFDLDTTSDPDGTGTDEAIRMPRVGTWEGGVIKGVLTGKSAGVKRPSGSEGNGGSGKINVLMEMWHSVYKKKLLCVMHHIVTFLNPLI